LAPRPPPELYDVLTERQGNELDPRAARFSPDPVDLEHSPTTDSA
jgi:hypothetical protein